MKETRQQILDRLRSIAEHPDEVIPEIVIKRREPREPRQARMCCPTCGRPL